MCVLRCIERLLHKNHHCCCVPALQCSATLHACLQKRDLGSLRERCAGLEQALESARVLAAQQATQLVEVHAAHRETADT